VAEFAVAFREPPSLKTMRKVKAATYLRRWQLHCGKCISFLLTTIITHKLLMPQSSSPTPPLFSLSNSPTKSPWTVRRVRWDKFRPIAPLVPLIFANKFERRAEQQVNTTRKPRKMRRCGDHTRDDSEVNAKDTKTRIHDPGRHFALMWCSRCAAATFFSVAHFRFFFLFL
jgi:hypothetical protein